MCYNWAQYYPNIVEKIVKVKPIKKVLQKNHPHIKEFTKNAPFYEKYNIIQKRVAKELLKKIEKRHKKILDLGCGSGEIYKNLPFNPKFFVGVDLSLQMCKLHPKKENIKILNESFDNPNLYEKLKPLSPFDLIISSSALQWAKDLDFILYNLKNLKGDWLFSIFCDKTFKTIQKITNQPSILPKKRDIIKTVSKYRKCEFQTINYKLFFKDNISKFRYIKKSGVSGGERRLSFKEIKYLIDNYPLPYLEFEVLYIFSLESS